MVLQQRDATDLTIDYGSLCVLQTRAVRLSLNGRDDIVVVIGKVRHVGEALDG